LNISCVCAAKKSLYASVSPPESCPKRTGQKALVNHLKDIIELFRKCYSDWLHAPAYIICIPTEVPVMPAIAYSRLATKVNKIQQNLGSYKWKVNTLWA
jgi:hypothetical protein